MPYGTPEVGSAAAEYNLRVNDATAGGNLCVAVEFDSDYIPSPTETQRDAFMQRVIDLFAQSPDFVVVMAQKQYGSSQTLTPTS